MMDAWYALKEAVGLSCTFGPKDVQYAICRVKRDRNEVEITAQKHFYDRISLMRYLKNCKGLPVALHVEGKGVLLKEMPLTPELSEDQLRAVFPHYHAETYLYSYFPGQHKAWLALSKKEIVEALLSDFREEGIQIVRLFLGPFVAENVLEQLNGYSGHYTFQGHNITKDITEGKWEGYHYDAASHARFSIKIQGADMAEQYVMAYAAAFSLLMHRFVADLHVSCHQVDELFSDFLQGIRFKVNGLALLLLFFVLLLVNTIVYAHYQTRYEAMDSRTKENFSNVHETEKLAGEVARQDSLLAALGWNGGIPKSWILHQLAASLRDSRGVDWQQVAINPPSSRRFGTTLEEIDNRYNIQIMGTCQTLNELEGWVRSLQQLPWLKQIEISKFTEQNKPESERKDFVVTLLYTYDF